jgi:hypothetical protein
MYKINRLIGLITLGILSIPSYSQQEPNIEDRVITTAVPFLMISGDARASGMGDQGIATSVDAFSQQWNAAKYVFSETEQSVGLSYTPYLRELADDINLGQLTYFNRINQRSAFAGSLRVFGLGGVELRQTPEQVPQEVEPTELSFDGSYALRLSETFSMAVTGRYIRSDLQFPGSGGDASAANTFAADISAFYRGEEKFYKNFNGRWRFGAKISNIGPKISYDDAGNDNFIPTNFKVGAGFDFILDVDNKISTSVEFNKLLVPTPKDSNGDGFINQEDDFFTTNEYSAIFSSWGDAPDGLSEELKEITWALGAEYWYQDSFAFRVGYFNESEEKGFRQFATLGAGFKFSRINIDTSYLFSTTQGVQNPLEGTLRFSLTFNFGEGTYIEY